MKVSELKSILQQLEQIYEMAGAKKPANDIREVLELFDDNNDQTVGEFAENMKQALNLPKQKPKSKSSKSDNGVVQSYMRMLIEIDSDEIKFKQVIDQLKNDKSVRKVEMVAIADRYINHKQNYRTKLDALKAVKNKFVERVRFKNEVQILNNLTPW